MTKKTSTPHEMAEEEFCEKHEQPMWKNEMKCGGCCEEEAAALAAAARAARAVAEAAAARVTVTKYQVFVDNFSGFTWVPALGADTLAETVEAIQNRPGHSQHWMYYIYALHESRVPLWGTKPDVYRHVKAVAGSLVEPALLQRCRGGMEYALTTWSGPPDWLFCDII